MRAALLLSLIYALAVLSPAVANAFAPSLAKVTHHFGLLAAEQSQLDGHHAHDHAGGHDHQHHNQSDDANSPQIDQCCELACISALPAGVLDVSGPSTLLSDRLAWSADQAASRAPPELYRPPIL